MANTTFDPRVQVGGTNLFTGEFTQYALRQIPEIGHHVSNRVIDPARPLLIDLTWKVTGAEVPLRMNATAGSWRVYAYAESMGPGPEIELMDSPQVLPVGAIAANAMEWSYTLSVPPGKLVEHAGDFVSGVYKIVVVVFANSTLPGPGNDVIGMAELPLILSEQPE